MGHVVSSPGTSSSSLLTNICGGILNCIVTKLGLFLKTLTNMLRNLMAVSYRPCLVCKWSQLIHCLSTLNQHFYVPSFISCLHHIFSLKVAPMMKALYFVYMKRGTVVGMSLLSIFARNVGYVVSH